MKLWEVNTISLFSLGSLAVNVEKGLTILLLLTAIILNIKKFFDKND
ncbi:hypothetical protein [Flagellimonas sp. 2504JD4-2]